MIKLYDIIENTHNSSEIIVTHWGTSTKFEAVSRIELNEETGQWQGFLIFKDERFSPTKEIAGLQFKHQTPGAGNGVLGERRAGRWETLTNIFTALMGVSTGHRG